MKQLGSKIVRVLALAMLTACAQHDDTRTFVPFDATPIFTLPNSTLDVYPERPRLTSYGLVVIDKMQKNIKIIDPRTSQVVLSFGRGGKGPGEYQQIWHIADHDSLLFVLDTSLHRLTIVSGTNGEVIRTIPVRKDPIRIESNGEYYAMNSIGTDSLIYLFDLKSDSLLAKANVENLDIQNKYALSMQGFFTFQDDKINYFPAFDGRIFEYTVSDGAFVNYRVIETPDTSRFKPTVSLNAMGTFSAQRPPIDYVRMGASHDNGKYYSLSRYIYMEKRELVYAVVDVFDESLTYEYSLDISKIKPMPQQMTVKNGIVCFMDLEILNCYKLP